MTVEGGAARSGRDPGGRPVDGPGVDRFLGAGYGGTGAQEAAAPCHRSAPDPGCAACFWYEDAEVGSVPAIMVRALRIGVVSGARVGAVAGLLGIFWGPLVLLTVPIGAAIGAIVGSVMGLVAAVALSAARPHLFRHDWLAALIGALVMPVAVLAVELDTGSAIGTVPWVLVAVGAAVGAPAGTRAVYGDRTACIRCGRWIVRPR